MSQFKLCESAGLDIYSERFEDSLGPKKHFVVKAEDVEALLRDAPVVYGGTDCDGRGEYNNPFSNYHSMGIDTHTARLVCIEPIVRDTAEGLLREFVEQREIRGPDSLVERARKLLEGK